MKTDVRMSGAPIARWQTGSVGAGGRCAVRTSLTVVRNSDTTMETADSTAEAHARVAEFAPLVRRMARHLHARLPASVQIDDVIQAGMVGLLDAANRFVEAKGNQFLTFAAPRIRGAMLDELRQNDWLPRAARSDLRRFAQATRDLEHKLGRAPTEAQIAAEIGISLVDYQTRLSLRGVEIVHFEDMAQHEDEFLERHCADEQHDPVVQLTERGCRSALVAAVELLPQRERVLMNLHYEEDMNFRQIGEVLGVGETRVCQLHSRAIARLRGRLHDAVLQ